MRIEAGFLPVAGGDQSGTGIYPGLVVLHIPASPEICPAGLHVEGEIVLLSVGILPPGAPYVSPVTAPPFSLGKGGGLDAEDIRLLLLGEIASSFDLLEGSSSVPVVPPLAVIEGTVEAPGAQGASRGCEQSAPLVGSRLPGRYVDDSGIPVGPVTGRGRGEDLDVLDGSRRYLLESRSPFQGAGFPVNIYKITNIFSNTTI